MTNISEYIHEILCVFVFVAAISLLVALSNKGYEANRAIEDQQVQKNTISQGSSYTPVDVTANGATVYYNILQMAKSKSGMQVFIDNGSGKTPVPTEVMTELKNTGASSGLAFSAGSGSLYIDVTPGQKYIRSDMVDSNGEISGVLYTKQ